jgi:uncharacterized protein (DUF2141 family)
MLRKCQTQFILSFALAAITAHSASAAEVAVTVTNVRSSSGSILAQLCDKNTFLKRCPFPMLVKATKGSVVLNFKDVPPGKYAVSLFHDENDNKQLEKNVLGIPTEGYGFSRNARGFRAPPSFINASFDVKEGNNKISLKMFN